MSTTKKYLYIAIFAILGCNILMTVMLNNTAPLKEEIAKLRIETEELKQSSKELQALQALKEELKAERQQIAEASAQLGELLQNVQTAKAEGTAALADNLAAAAKSFDEKVASSQAHIGAIEKTLNDLKAFSEKVAQAEFERAKNELERLSAHVTNMEKQLAQ